MQELYNKKPDCNNNGTEYAIGNGTSTLNSSILTLDLSSEAIVNQVETNIDGPDRNIVTSDNLLTSSANIIHPNRFQALINDSDTSFETEFRKANIKTSNNADINKKNRRQVVINQFRERRVKICQKKDQNINQFPESRIPEKDQNNYNRPKTITGNSSYSKITKNGKNVLILSDSMLGKIQMKKFNVLLIDGFAFRKHFPGATAAEIAHYCLPTLEKEKPDVTIRHAGSNNLQGDEIETIWNQLLDLVNNCREVGVNEVFISGLTFRTYHVNKVRNLNHLIKSKETNHDFSFINNDNILKNDICTDNVHLKYSGIVKVSDNIINAINALPS